MKESIRKSEEFEKYQTFFQFLYYSHFSVQSRTNFIISFPYFISAFTISLCASAYTSLSVSRTLNLKHKLHVKMMSLLFCDCLHTFARVYVSCMLCIVYIVLYIALLFVWLRMKVALHVESVMQKYKSEKKNSHIVECK